MDNFLLEERIGSKFLAKRLSDNTEVIIQYIDINLLDENDILNMMNEISILKSLSLYPSCSKYVICYYENFIIDNKIAIVQEYIKGINLIDFYNKETKNTKYILSNILWPIFMNMILGLDNIHKKHISHGDINLNNIMITFDGQIKYINLKLYCLNYFDKFNRFLAPENFDRKLNDKLISLEMRQKADIWSLGITMFLLANGNFPTKLDLKSTYPHDDRINILIEYILNPNPNIRPNINNIIDKLKILYN